MNAPSRRWFDRRDGNSGSRATSVMGPRVVVVGPCAAGKSTLAAGLRELGFDARVCGQEHSEISTLWLRQQPDVVVALDVDLETIRARRQEAAWPRWLYETQRRRLRHANDAAALRIDTALLGQDEVLAAVSGFLAERDALSGAAPESPLSSR